MNSEGEEVIGDEIKLVWKEAYRKLGQEFIENENFDEEFAKQVEKEIEDMIQNNNEKFSELDIQITLEEVEKIVSRLKNGKAAGTDGIVNEILRFGGENMNLAIWQLCKMMFGKEQVPDEWLEGIIFPIYKDSDRRDPLNYRGITLLSVVSKVYTSILNERLTK